MKTLLQNGVIRPNLATVLSDNEGMVSAVPAKSGQNRTTKDDVINTVGANSRSPQMGNETDSIAVFLESMQSNHVSANTIRSYAADIRCFVEFMRQRGRAELVETQPSDIDLFIRQLTIEDSSASTIRRTRSGLKKFFRFLLENGTIAADPFEANTLTEGFSDHLTLSTILSIAAYCKRRYDNENTEETLRYRRDELILLLMIVYGLRQYHISTLKLSALKRDGNSVFIVVSEQFSLKLEGIVLQKLYQYLKLRNSKADVVFIDGKTGKPVTDRTIHSLMIELSYAVRAQVNPRTLYHTHLHLQRHPEDAAQLLRELSKLDEENE